MRVCTGQQILTLAAATGAGSWVAIEPADGHQPMFTWQTVITGGPASVTVALEGSIDGGTTSFSLDSSTNTSGEVKHLTGKGALQVRANLTTLTGGTSPKVSVNLAAF